MAGRACPGLDPGDAGLHHSLVAAGLRARHFTSLISPRESFQSANRAYTNVQREKSSCQQAAEKAVKAALVHLQIPFPKTHDIVDLLTLLHQGGVEIPEEIRREIKTFLDEFPCVSGWMPSKLNLLLLGSDVTPELNVERIRIIMEDEDIRKDLADIGIGNVRQLLDTFTATRKALVEYAGNVPPLTDDVPAIEYYRRFGMDSLAMKQGAAALRECSLEEGFPELRRKIALVAGH